MGGMPAKRVLIVDDEPNVAMVLAENIEALGENYFVETASSGKETLEKVCSHHYTLVLTDYRMPGMNGVDLAKAIQSCSPETKVILMTAHGSLELQRTLEQLELAGYIDKPFSMQEIRQIVKRLVEQAVAARVEGQDVARPTALEADVNQELQQLQRNSGARCVLLLSTSGYPIDVVGESQGLDVFGLSALIAANFLAAAEVATLLGTGSVFRTSYHEGPDYNFYSYDVNGSLLLTVIFDANAKPGVIWLYTKRTAQVLETMLDEPLPRQAEATAALLADMDLDNEIDQLFG